MLEEGKVDGGWLVDGGVHSFVINQQICFYCPMFRSWEVYARLLLMPMS
jgi:hypothetical protein